MALSRNVLLAFFFGLLVGNLRPVQKIFSALPSIRRVNKFLIGMTYPPVCEDQYVDYPVGKPMSLDEMGVNFSPIPGLSHLTLGGHQHFGNRKIEMWYETLAPGAGTPIHSTSSEVIFFFLDGEVTLTTRARDGSLVIHEMLQNTTTTVLPNARHQMVNPGPGDASYILAFDTPPMGPILSYDTWNAPRGKPMGPLPWDTACPGPPPPPPPPIDLDELNAQLRRGEL